MTRSRVLTLGLSLWLVVGAVIAGVLALVTRATNAFAISGIALTFMSVGMTLGPFKTPMVWSEGGLVAYQANAMGAEGRKPSRLRLMAIPACAFAAGVLLLVIAGASAAL